LTHIEPEILSAIPYPDIVSKTMAYAEIPSAIIISCDETHKGALVKVNLPKLDIGGAKNLEELPWSMIGLEDYIIPTYGELKRVDYT